jgi:mycothiol synthase
VTVPDGYLIRPAIREDIDDVAELCAACDLIDVGFEDPVREAILEMWRLSGLDLASDTVLVFSRDGTIAGYAEAVGTHPEVAIEGFGRVHPDHRGRGLGRFLMNWIEHRAAEHASAAGGPCKLWNDLPCVDADAAGMLTAHGYVHVRTFRHMERTLAADETPTEPPPGIRFRTFDEGRDEIKAHEVWLGSFSDHFGFAEGSFEEFTHDFFGGPGFEPDLMLLAEEDGETVGMNWSVVLGEVGWVNIVGVLKPWRGKGIATALLERAFCDLAARGCTSVRLNVDGSNETGATRLYERIGMTVRREWCLFEKLVQPG